MAQWASHNGMARRLASLLFVSLAFALFVVPSQMFAQFGGMGRRYPGGGNPYPQQTQQQNTPKVFGPTEDLTGMLQSINDSSLVLDEGDDAIVLVQIQKGTKYLSTADKVKASDFEPGDHVTVEATRDADDHYYSKSITMNKKGTAQDKATEMQASSGHATGGSTSGGPSSSDDDPNRPRLHRANPDGGSSDSGSSPSATNSPSSGASSASAPTSSSTDDDPNRPRLHRSGTDSGSGSANSDAVTTSRRPAATSDDDSGPPVLRRGSTPSDSSGSNQQVASASAPASRPSLSATDANGVTHLPDVPPPPSGAPDDSQGDTRTARGTYSGGGGDSIIGQAREAAFTFTETLPNYVVKQLTNRYASDNAVRGRTSWTPLDIVTTDLVYEDGKERYTNVMVNGKATKYIEQTGSWSEGEFASMMQAILAPQSNTDFRNQRPVTIVNRPAYKYDYTIEQPRSTWELHADGQVYSPGYTGSIWIDKATYRVLRIELAARNLPRNFPIDTAESSIDYDFVMIGDKKVLLPADADSLSCTRGSSDCTKNHTEFHNYRKYGADSSISFGDTTN